VPNSVNSVQVAPVAEVTKAAELQPDDSSVLKLAQLLLRLLLPSQLYLLCRSTHFAPFFVPFVINCRIMKITKNVGMLLLAVYLIVDGLLGFGLNLGPAIFLLYVVALAAGIFILIGK
jgi:hypothetical protein